MAVGTGATPLIGLDAVVLDTETTGLDARKVRIVEIGAVRLVGGRLGADEPFRRLVQPGEDIPVAATRIHGIDAKAVAGAPVFAEVWPDLSAYLGDSVLIGHTLGFDLIVLQRECERIGQTFRIPPWLDIRLLGQLADPNLAGYSLDNLAVWLDLQISGRHSAVGDATATAEVFCALAPRLRERGIRTFAEAVSASRTLTGVLDDQQRAGWADMATASEVLTHGSGEGIDPYPYRHRVAAVMASPAKTVAAGTLIGAALERLTSDRISSLFVVSGDGPWRPERTGIITERDVLRALNAHGAAALALPVEQAMSLPLLAVPAGTFAYHAIARMNRLRVRHLGVTDEAGNVIGALSARDLLRLRAEEAVELGDEIDQAQDVHDLARSWGRLARVAASLVQEGLSAREIAAVISHELAELTRRATVLAERAMQESGHGSPPCPYAVIVLGSAGRGESLLAMDQDNALVFADAAPDGADAWFAALGERVADTLHEAGVPYCKGGVMARNPQWRGSLAAWRHRIDDWIGRANPQDLLSVDIFFDLRAVFGRVELVHELTHYAFEAARGQTAFAKLLVEAGGAIESSRTWFGGIRTDNGRIDLKRAGLFGVVSSARALAICRHVTERSTPARLEGIKAFHLGSESDLDAMIEAQGVFLDLILRQQVADIGQGQPPSNAVEVKRLSRRERQRLLAALRAVEHLDETTRDLLFRT